MHGSLESSTQKKLWAFDQQVRKRAAVAALGYSLGIAGAVGLYLYLPFILSRIGSLILVIALGHMMVKVYAASKASFLPAGLQTEDRRAKEVRKVEAQIELFQSAIHNLPFIAGANLFLIGLPGPGSEEAKAWLNCFFLLGTVFVFSRSYLLNQQTVREELLPLRGELEREDDCKNV